MSLLSVTLLHSLLSLMAFNAVILGSSLSALQLPLMLIPDPITSRILHTVSVQVAYEVALWNGWTSRPNTPKQLVCAVGAYWLIRILLSFYQVGTSSMSKAPATKAAHGMASRSNSPAWGLALLTGGLIDLAVIGLATSFALTSDAISSGILAAHLAFR